MKKILGKKKLFKKVGKQERTKLFIFFLCIGSVLSVWVLDTVEVHPITLKIFSLMKQFSTYLNF